MCNKFYTVFLGYHAESNSQKNSWCSSDLKQLIILLHDTLYLAEDFFSWVEIRRVRRKIHETCTCWFVIKSATPSVWWTDALSIITTEQGFTQLNGCRIGRTVLLRKSNRWPVIVPSIICMSCIPFTDITGTTEYRVPRTSRRWSLGGTPLRLYPHFRVLLRRSHQARVA